MKTVAVVAGVVLISLLLPFQTRPGPPASRKVENPRMWQVLAAKTILLLGLESEWAEDVERRELAHALKRAIPPADASRFVFRLPTESKGDAEPEEP